jgi:hypothetical protein
LFFWFAAGSVRLIKQAVTIAAPPQPNAPPPPPLAMDD